MTTKKTVDEDDGSAQYALANATALKAKAAKSRAEAEEALLAVEVSHKLAAKSQATATAAEKSARDAEISVSKAAEEARKRLDVELGVKPKEDKPAPEVPPAA